MKVIEIQGASGAGVILRSQQIPDAWIVEGGVITSGLGHRVFPATSRWYPAPVGAQDGDTYDPATDTLTPKPGPSASEIRERKIVEAHGEASRRRSVALAVLSDGVDIPEDLAIRNFQSLTARASAKIRRESKGQGRPDESTVLDQLEAIADQLEGIDAARDTIIQEVQASGDPANYDVVNSPHWP